MAVSNSERKSIPSPPDIQMSIRIQNDQLAGTQAAETSRASEISRNSTSAARKGGGATGGGTDQVEISSLSEGITAANETQQVHESNRVHQLSALYASGRYNVDPMAVSRAMVSHGLATSGTGSEA